MNTTAKKTTRFSYPKIKGEKKNNQFANNYLDKD
jgi:hypothetical protein